MVLPHYRGKPLAGKQTKSDANVADVRSSAITTALREINEELNITLSGDVFNEDIFVEWYPKQRSAKQGGSKCETPARQNKCIQNSLKQQLVKPNSKLVTWEWIKEEPNTVKTNSGAQIPNIEQAMSSKSYPGLNTLYKIIHLRTKSLDNFNWGKKWIDAPGGVDDRRPPGLNEQASPAEVIQFYPPPFQPWQQDEGDLLPLCFTVYETPESTTSKQISQLEQKSASTSAVTTSSAAKESATSKTTTTTGKATEGGIRKKHVKKASRKKGKRKGKRNTRRKRKLSKN